MSLSVKEQKVQAPRTQITSCGHHSMVDMVTITCALWVIRLLMLGESKMLSALMKRSMRQESSKSCVPASRWTMSVILVIRGIQRVVAASKLSLMIQIKIISP